MMNEQRMQELVSLRRKLHRYPEISGQETETARCMVDFLTQHTRAKIFSDIGGTGVVALFAFADSGPTVLIRCELDALPIREINSFAHTSTVENVSHKCGHDGHMTILAGLAAALIEKKFPAGRVLLLFQPAEETGAGALAVLKHKILKKYKPDHVFALHNLPGFPMHTVVCRPGNFTPAVKSMIVRLQGKTAHAGEPHKGINPSLAVAEIIQQTRPLEKDADTVDFTLVTPVHIKVGEEAYGISAGYGEVHFTLRTWDNNSLRRICKHVEAIVRAIAEKHHLEVEIAWTQVFASNENNPEMVEIIKKAALKNGFNYQHKSEPFTWGEDFGLFTEKYPGAMFGLGAGEETPALHNPDYDFPDEIIPTGVQLFMDIITQLLEKE